ncbi:MAG: hypothetical protein HC921_21530 [Synechococcaceae cyanobacterium SM2_3_1]|nr:hypothetical protein [Synechococcaceae cyanobacterium SM2_3_1]
MKKCKQIQDYHHDELKNRIWSLLADGDTRKTMAVLDCLSRFEQEEKQWSPEIDDAIIHSFIHHPSEYLMPIIDYMHNHPCSKLGAKCAYFLGEIGYFQREEQDPQILPSIVKALEIILKQNSFSIEDTQLYLCGIRQLAWFGNILESEYVVREVFNRAELKQVVDYYPWILRTALDILTIINGKIFLEELRRKVSDCSNKNEFIWEIKYFLMEQDMDEITAKAPQSLDEIIDALRREIDYDTESKEVSFLFSILHQVAENQGSQYDGRIPVITLDLLKTKLSRSQTHNIYWVISEINRFNFYFDFINDLKPVLYFLYEAIKSKPKEDFYPYPNNGDCDLEIEEFYCNVVLEILKGLYLAEGSRFIDFLEKDIDKLNKSCEALPIIKSFVNRKEVTCISQ